MSSIDWRVCALRVDMHTLESHANSVPMNLNQTMLVLSGHNNTYTYTQKEKRPELKPKNGKPSIKRPPR